MYKTLTTLALVVLAAVSAMVGYKLAEQKITNAIYKNRLEQMAGEYRDLRDQYNQAVRRTAVTELVVADGKLSVVIRNAEGVERTIDLPYDPANEIYCDYLVMDGRLWIRRVYDDRTAPAQGTVIDPDISNVDWSSDTVRHGNAVYRALTDGRWVVTVTGDGSLGLVKQQGDARPHLIAAPEVRQFDEIEREINAEVEKIGVTDVLQQVW